MKKYALIGLGTGGSRAIDSFNYEGIEKIAIDSDEECLNSLQNSRTIKVNIKKEDKNFNLDKKDKEKILNLIKGYDNV